MKMFYRYSVSQERVNAVEFAHCQCICDLKQITISKCVNHFIVDFKIKKRDFSICFSHLLRMRKKLYEILFILNESLANSLTGGQLALDCLQHELDQSQKKGKGRFMLDRVILTRFRAEIT